MVSLRAIFQTPRLELRIFVRQRRGGRYPVRHKEKSWLSVDIPFIGRMRLALEWVKRALQCCSLNLEMGLERPPQRQSEADTRGTTLLSTRGRSSSGSCFQSSRALEGRFQGTPQFSCLIGESVSIFSERPLAR
jgi:hypothetical protein